MTLHAIMFANYLRQTISEATRKSSLQYCGVPDNPETLEWHADLLLNELASLLELDEYPRSFPWRCVASLSAPLQESTLDAMREEWSFVTNVVDCLKPRTRLHTMLAVTRHQCYRDLMIKAETLVS